MLAKQIGPLTRFASLELGCDSSRKNAACDSGYSCAYQYNLAWSSPTTPVTPETNPRLVFERLFGLGHPASGRRTSSAAGKSSGLSSISSSKTRAPCNNGSTLETETS